MKSPAIKHPYGGQTVVNKKCRKKLFFPAKNFTHYTVSLHNVLINMTATTKSTFKVEQNSN